MSDLYKTIQKADRYDKLVAEIERRRKDLSEVVNYTDEQAASICGQDTALESILEWLTQEEKK